MIVILNSWSGPFPFSECKLLHDPARGNARSAHFIIAPDEITAAFVGARQAR
jgi:hypothetical protein